MWACCLSPRSKLRLLFCYLKWYLFDSNASLYLINYYVLVHILCNILWSKWLRYHIEVLKWSFFKFILKFDPYSGLTKFMLLIAFASFAGWKSCQHVKLLPSTTRRPPEEIVKLERSWKIRVSPKTAAKAGLFVHSISSYRVLFLFIFINRHKKLVLGLLIALIN